MNGERPRIHSLTQSRDLCVPPRCCLLLVVVVDLDVDVDVDSLFAFVVVVAARAAVMLWLVFVFVFLSAFVVRGGQSTVISVSALAVFHR